MNNIYDLDGGHFVLNRNLEVGDKFVYNNKVYKLITTLENDTYYYTLIDLSTGVHADILFSIFTLRVGDDLKYLTNFIQKYYHHVPPFGINIFPKTTSLKQITNLIHGLVEILVASKKKNVASNVDKQLENKTKAETNAIKAETLQADEKKLDEDFIPLIPNAAITYDLDIRPDYIYRLEGGDTIKYLNKVYKVVVQRGGDGGSDYPVQSCNLVSTKDNDHNRLVLDACCYSPYLLRETGLYQELKRVNPADNIPLDMCKSPIWYTNIDRLTDLVNMCIEQIRKNKALEDLDQLKVDQNKIIKEGALPLNYDLNKMDEWITELNLGDTVWYNGRGYKVSVNYTTNTPLYKFVSIDNWPKSDNQIIFDAYRCQFSNIGDICNSLFSMTCFVNKLIQQEIDHRNMANKAVGTKTETAMKEHNLKYKTTGTDGYYPDGFKNILKDSMAAMPTGTMLDYFGATDPRTFKHSDPMARGAERGRSPAPAPETKPGRYL